VNIPYLAVNVNETKHGGRTREIVDGKQAIRPGWAILNRRWVGAIAFQLPIRGEIPIVEGRDGGVDRKTRVESHNE